MFNHHVLVPEGVMEHQLLNLLMKKLGSNKLSDLPEVTWVSDSEWNPNFQIHSPVLYWVPPAASYIKASQIQYNYSPYK